METTFMTIHNLSPDANILFVSDSIVDILGYQPQDVTGKSCFDYFHPEELPFARQIHNRGLRLDKAAVLNYAQIRNREGKWIGCECVFTVTYDVLVACTSIYQANEKNQRRAAEAPAIRRLFASSPRDPRYHMLEDLSSKFRAQPTQREPRAALILNRFSRTLTVMYATDAIHTILGVTADQFKEKSFYECIQENCLPEAIRCLESAKANDSIAYLRFWYRDPRRVEDMDEEMRDASVSSDSEGGGVELYGYMDVDMELVAGSSNSGSASHSGQGASSTQHSGQDSSGDNEAIHVSASPQSLPRQNSSRTSSRHSTSVNYDSADAVFDREHNSRSSTSSLPSSPESRRRTTPARVAAPPPPPPAVDPFEIEAVVSCTSDGLVVVLRRARPGIPQQSAGAPQFPRGLFAAPWGANPIRPRRYRPDLPNPYRHGLDAPAVPDAGAVDDAFLLEIGEATSTGGPPEEIFMGSIREVAVFAWSVTGINGNIASYGRGVPRGQAQPPGGLPVWDPQAPPNPEILPPANQALERWTRMDERTNEPNNNAPFQNAGEESNPRNQNALGSGPTGYDRSGSSAHRYLGSLTGYAYQGPGNYQNNNYENLFGQSQQGTSAGPPPEEANSPAVTQGPQGPSEGTRGNRYIWY